MSWVRIIVLTVVLLMLGGYVFLYDLLEIKEARENPETEAIIHFDPEHLQAIEIVLINKKQTIFLKKEDSQWRIKKPLGAPADPKRVDDLLSIFDYGYIEVIDESPSDISQYGLHTPEVELTITVNDERHITSHTLLFGSNNPTNNACYCKIKDEPKIFLVGVLYKNDLEKDVSFYLPKSP